MQPTVRTSRSRACDSLEGVYAVPPAVLWIICRENAIYTSQNNRGLFVYQMVSGGAGVGMRVTAEEQALALGVIRARFGEARTWLFGSRTDDTAKGGDIDLYVELPAPVSALTLARARGDLIDALGRHVDLVVNDGRRNEPIYAIARAQGLQLI